MVAPTSTKAFCNWMYSTSFKDIPLDVRQMAVLAIYDGIGGNLACSLLPVAHRMVDFARVAGGSLECSMIGFPLRTSALHAALVNGTLGHADELDAGEEDRHHGTHILAPVMAAALAAGQLAGASGQEVVRAAVLGHELSKRIHGVATQVRRDTGRAFGPIDPGNTMGSTVAAGISLGLPPDRMEVALSLAAHLACALRPLEQETQHDVAAFVLGGAGAKNGVAAALMAKVGFDAPAEVLDGPQGFFRSRLGVEVPGPEFLHGLGEEYGIRGSVFKRDSAGVRIQAPRQAIREVMAENKLVADDIAEVLLEVNQESFSNMTGIRHPTSNGRDMVALAAVYSGMGFREAHLETFYNSPEVQRVRDLVKIQIKREWNDEEHRFHAAITVTTKDGRKIYKESAYKRMTEEELDAKFSYLVGLRAGDAKAKELAQSLKRLDRVSNVAEVMVQLELPEAVIEQHNAPQKKER